MRDLWRWTKRNVEVVKSAVPQQMRGEIIPQLGQPAEHRVSDAHTKALGVADDVHDPAEFAVVNDEL